MQRPEDPAFVVPDPVPASTTRPTRLVRQASFTTAIAAIVSIGAILAAMSVAGSASPTPSPAGLVGAAETPAPTVPDDSVVAPTPNIASADFPDETAGDGPSSAPSAAPTPWRTSPPSTCNPYVKMCDPTIPPVYDYVGVILTADQVGDIYGSGKVTVTAGNRTYTCAPTTSRTNCFWDIPPGVTVVARQYPAAGSYCQRFYLIWEDFVFIEPGDCSPISFTTKTMEAQIIVEFGPNILLTPPPATEPPATDPPATDTPTDTPAAPPEPTSSPS